MRTSSIMIRMYCRDRHGVKSGLCAECQELREYALARLMACPFNENKTVCAQCRVHCYQPVRRDKMKEVMRYSGPRMMFRHPLLAIRHVIESRKAATPGKGGRPA